MKNNSSIPGWFIPATLTAILVIAVAALLWHPSEPLQVDCSKEVQEFVGEFGCIGEVRIDGADQRHVYEPSAFLLKEKIRVEAITVDEESRQHQFIAEFRKAIDENEKEIDLVRVMRVNLFVGGAFKEQILVGIVF